MALPAEITAYPDAIAGALNQLRLVGVNGPYSVVLSSDAYQALSEASDHGYPVLEHIKRIVDGELVWAPGITAPTCSQHVAAISLSTSAKIIDRLLES